MVPGRFRATALPALCPLRSKNSDSSTDLLLDLAVRSHRFFKNASTKAYATFPQYYLSHYQLIIFTQWDKFNLMDSTSLGYYDFRILRVYWTFPWIQGLWLLFTRTLFFINHAVWILIFCRNISIRVIMQWNVLVLAARKVQTSRRQRQARLAHQQLWISRRPVEEYLRDASRRAPRRSSRCLLRLRPSRHRSWRWRAPAGRYASSPCRPWRPPRQRRQVRRAARRRWRTRRCSPSGRRSASTRRCSRAPRPALASCRHPRRLFRDLHSSRAPHSPSDLSTRFRYCIASLLCPLLSSNVFISSRCSAQSILYIFTIGLTLAIQLRTINWKLRKSIFHVPSLYS